MKSIIYTGAFRFPNGDAGSPRVLNNAKIFKELGYEITFIAWGGAYSDKYKKDVDYYYNDFKYIISRDIDISNQSYIKKIYNHIFCGINAYRIIKNINNKVDIIIVYNPSAFFSVILKLYCKNHNIRFVSDITEWYNSNEFPGGRIFPPFWISELNMRFVQKLINNKILISTLLDRYYNKSNNLVIPPLIDCTEKKWNSTNVILEKYDGIRLIYAGNPKNKDMLELMLNTVLSCINKGMHFQFLILGITKEDISHYINFDRISSLVFNFIFLGKVDHNQVPSYFKSSDFSLIIRKPTRKNMAGFPTKLAESLGSGCPVILNLTSDISNYVKDGYNGFIIKDCTSIEFENVLCKINSLSYNDLQLLKMYSKKSANELFDYRNYMTNFNSFINRLK